MCRWLIDRVPGKKMVCVYSLKEENFELFEELIHGINHGEDVIYIMFVNVTGWEFAEFQVLCPNLVYCYFQKFEFFSSVKSDSDSDYDIDEFEYKVDTEVLYRPDLLNSRNIVDVMFAVSGRRVSGCSQQWFDMEMDELRFRANTLSTQKKIDPILVNLSLFVPNISLYEVGWEASDSIEFVPNTVMGLLKEKKENHTRKISKKNKKKRKY